MTTRAAHLRRRPPRGRARWRHGVLALLLPLLLFAQAQAHVHAFEHVARDAGDHAHAVTLAGADTPRCLQCDLLAGGFPAVAGTPAVAGIHGTPPWLAPCPCPSCTQERRAWFESRAPPILL